MPQVILKRFETPDEVISFEKGRFEKITLGGYADWPLTRVLAGAPEFHAAELLRDS